MGETTPDEERRLMAWRAASAENDAHFRTLSATWELSGKGHELRAGTPPAAGDIIARASRIEPAAGRSRERRRVARRPRRRGLWVAGAGTLAAAALAAVLLSRSSDIPLPPAVTTETIVAAEARTVQLADGSAVHLAPGATLRFDPVQPRNVWLEGRAYFGVSADPENPFFVHTPAGVTRVLGTRFDVRADPSQLTVVVVEGRVRVLTDKGEVEVGNGQQSRAVRDSLPVVEPADPDAVTGWLEQVFIFQATRLTEVARELERRYERPIEILDAELGERTVTAVFADRRLDEILPALCRAVEAECLDSAGVVQIRLRTSFPNR
jgi:transmembrane sensor